MSTIHTLTLNPAIDKTVQVPGFSLDAVNRVASVRSDPGGKGFNVGKNLHTWGVSTTAWGLVGGKAGDWIAAALKELGLDTRLVPTRGETRTNLKVVDPQAGTHTDINEAGPALDTQAFGALTVQMLDALAPGDILVLSGSLPPGAPLGTYRDLIKAARARGALTILDADGPAFEQAIAAGPDLIKPNRHELERFVGRPLGSLADLVEVATHLLRQGVGRVVVSRGDEGALFCGPEGLWTAGGLKVQVQSTVGAGDTMVAALALGLSRGQTLDAMAPFALAAATAAVSTAGSAPCTLPEIQAILPRVQCSPLEAPQPPNPSPA